MATPVEQTQLENQEVSSTQLVTDQEVAEATPDSLETTDFDNLEEPQIPEAPPVDTGASFVSSLQIPELPEVDTGEVEQLKTEQTELQRQLKESLEGLAPTGARLTEEEDKLNIRQQEEQLRGLNLGIAQARGEFERAIQAEEGRVAPRSFITGAQAQIQRQAAVELGARAAEAQALAGNINLARQTAARTVDLEFADQQQRINTLSALINLNRDNLTSAEAKQAAEIEQNLSQQQAAIDAAKEEKQSIFDVATQAAEFGADAVTMRSILEADSREEALLLSSGVLAENRPVDTQLIDIGGRKKLVNTQTGEIIKDIGISDVDTPKPQKFGTDAFGNDIWGIFDPATGSVSPVTLPNSAAMDSSQLNSTVLNALAGIKFSSVDAKRTASADIKRLLANGNTEEAKSLLKRFVRNSATATQLEKIDGKEDLKTTLLGIQEDLRDFEKNGGDLGIFTGLKRKALEKGGITDDPRLSEIANRIAIAIVDYRKAVSGAAFTPSEAAEYERIFPSEGKTQELNEAKIESLIKTVDIQVDGFLKRNLGEDNWESLFGTTRTTPQLPPLTQSYRNIDALLGAQPEYVDLYEAILTEDPSLTDEEILREITEFSLGAEQPTGFNQPLSMGQNGLEKLSTGQTQLSVLGDGTITGFGSPVWEAGLDFVLSGGKGAPVSVKAPLEVVKVVSGFNNPGARPLGRDVGRSQNKGFGNQVTVRTPEGFEIDFSHLDKVANLQPGQQLASGTIFGTQGNTGLTLGRTGVHLDITGRDPEGNLLTAKEVAALLGDVRLS